MDFTRQLPGDKVFVRAVSENGITIAEETYDTPLVLLPDSVEANWPVRSVEGLTADALSPLLEREPEVVIIGTGAQQHFLDPQVMTLFWERGIGIEIMNTRAACRTFNVLVMEERRVLAALLPP